MIIPEGHLSIHLSIYPPTGCPNAIELFDQADSSLNPFRVFMNYWVDRKYCLERVIPVSFQLDHSLFGSHVKELLLEYVTAIFTTNSEWDISSTAALLVQWAAIEAARMVYDLVDH